jgi:hypothetical protein
MIWTWMIGLASGIGIAAFAPSLKTKSVAARLGMGVIAGAGVTFLINACLEVISYVRSL